MAVDTDTTTVDARSRLRQVPVQELVLPVVIVVLIIVGMIIKPGIFLTSDNLLNVLTQASITGIIAIGMTFVIATGGIDLSVGSALAAASIAECRRHLGDRATYEGFHRWHQAVQRRHQDRG